MSETAFIPYNIRDIAPRYEATQMPHDVPLRIERGAQFIGHEEFPAVSMEMSVHEYSFDSLCDRLLELERRTGVSTVEMFRRYVRGEHNDDEQIEEWVDLYFLYLGSVEIRRYSCP